jgi:hypothetical protein
MSKTVLGPEKMLTPAMGPEWRREDLDGTEGVVVMNMREGDTGESLVARMTLTRDT